MNPGKVELITEADFVLSKCGRPQPPVGSVVYIYKGFLVQAVLPVAAGDTYYKEITGDTTWCWRSISTAISPDPPAVQALVQSPDGKVLFNGLLDLTIIAGYGSNRYALSREIECPPGTKVQLALDDSYYNANAVQPVAMELGGAYAYYLRGGLRSDDPTKSVAALPRIFGSRNQNILAPCWAQGFGPIVQPGDEAFVYGDGTTNFATVTLGSSLTTKCTIPIDASYDFFVYRFLFDVTKDNTVTAGTFLAKIRAGSGYVFTDDYVDVAKYLGSSYLLKPWQVKNADSIQIDLSFVDSAGAGSANIQVFAEGVRRPRRIAA
jgi:hypothetical protein